MIQVTKNLSVEQSTKKLEKFTATNLKKVLAKAVQNPPQHGWHLSSQVAAGPAYAESARLALTPELSICGCAV